MSHVGKLRERHSGGKMSGGILWAFVIAGLLIAMEIARAELREWNARRKAVKRCRTLTAKYGIPWR